MKAIAQVRVRGQRGVTLVELLIAISLFALIGVSSSLVLRTAFDSLNRIDAKVDQDRRVLGSERALDQMLRGMVAVNAPCGGGPVGFQGSQNFVRFVSSYSLAEGSRGRLQFVEIIAEQKADGEGVRLVVNEYPYLGQARLNLLCSQPVAVRDMSFILADRLAFARFAYKRLEPGSAAEIWMSNWSYPEWPRAIRVDLEPLRLVENRARVQSLRIPVMVRNLSAP
ncbi:MAG: prepilin-type N-terminal cleavage/methylation domain-containing protein [Bryobacter sp.]|nr:prepilin-type N-terminal cleavage/methylation domain-containing protein [Bryobacter sp.]